MSEQCPGKSNRNSIAQEQHGNRQCVVTCRSCSSCRNLVKCLTSGCLVIAISSVASCIFLKTQPGFLGVMGLGRIQKQSWESPFVRTLWPVQPELRPQTRILRTLSVQGFFKSLLHCFVLQLCLRDNSWLVTTFIMLWTHKYLKYSRKRKIWLIPVPSRVCSPQGNSRYWSQRCTRMRNFKAACCSGTPCKTRNSWVVFYRTELHLWIVKI